MAEKSSTKTQPRSRRGKAREAEAGASQNGQGTEAATYEKELAAYLQQRIKPGLNSGAIPLLARSIAKEIARQDRPAGESKADDEKDKPDADADEKPTAEAADEPSDDAAKDEPSDESGDEDETPEGSGDEDESSDESGDEDETPEGSGDEDESSDESGDEDETPEDSGDEDETPEDSGDEDETPEGSGEEEEAPDFEADMHDLQSELGEDWILSFSVQGDDAWLTAAKADGSQRLEAPTAAVLSEAVQLLNEGGGRSS